MRKIYDTYATYGVYRHKDNFPFVDNYHDAMLYSYERSKSLYDNPDDYPMDEVLESLRDELEYIKHFKKIHILLATIPSHV